MMWICLRRRSACSMRFKERSTVFFSHIGDHWNGVNGLGTTHDALLEVCGPEAAALEGREVVLGYEVAQAGPDGKPNNPFMPKFPKKNKGKAPAEKK